MAEVWVKVCGLRTGADVAVAVDSGADAIGFVLADSPRQVTPDDARRLGAGAPVATVAVTVDLHPDDVAPLLEATGVAMLQPHGRHRFEAAAVAASLGRGVLLPVPVSGPVRPGDVGHGHMPILETAGSLHGGSGQTFDWSWIERDGSDFVLAGGLGPDNVAEAIDRTRPWGVDASSGLEASPGTKDPAKIRLYVTNARQP